VSEGFDPRAIEERGWRQGAVLGPGLHLAAAARAPSGVVVGEADWLIVTSHDCDVVSGSLDKEPFVEVLRAEVIERGAPDGQLTHGRNPRTLHLRVGEGAVAVVLRCRVHERWMVARELLAGEAPAHQLDSSSSRLIAEWLAKRYIRAAFPSSFDRRWHHGMKAWTKLLRKHSSTIQGVYLRLNTLDELAEGDPPEFRSMSPGKATMFVPSHAATAPLGPVKVPAR